MTSYVNEDRETGEWTEIELETEEDTTIVNMAGETIVIPYRHPSYSLSVSRISLSVEDKHFSDDKPSFWDEVAKCKGIIPIDIDKQRAAGRAEYEAATGLSMNRLAADIRKAKEAEQLSLFEGGCFRRAKQ